MQNSFKATDPELNVKGTVYLPNQNQSLIPEVNLSPWDSPIVGFGEKMKESVGFASVLDDGVQTLIGSFEPQSAYIRNNKTQLTNVGEDTDRDTLPSLKLSLPNLGVNIPQANRAITKGLPSKIKHVKLESDTSFFRPKQISSPKIESQLQFQPATIILSGQLFQSQDYSKLKLPLEEPKQHVYHNRYIP